MTTTPQRQTKTQSNANTTTTGYESDLWRMADALRGSMDAAEYKHVVLRERSLRQGNYIES